MTDIPWYTSHQTLVELGAWLVVRGDLDSAEGVIDYFEKPWHWQTEWDEYCADMDSIIGALQAIHGL